VLSLRILCYWSWKLFKFALCISTGDLLCRSLNYEKYLRKRFSTRLIKPLLRITSLDYLKAITLESLVLWRMSLYKTLKTLTVLNTGLALCEHAERWLMATAGGTMDSLLLVESGVSSCAYAVKPR